MIAKKVPNPKKSGGKAGRAGGLADYIKEPQLENGLEKCIHFEAVNFMTNDFAAQKFEMIALSQEAIKSKDPIDHWVLSFKRDEKPTKEQAKEAVEMFIKHCGLKGHQYMWALHDDTANMHIHIEVNRVNPDTLRVTKINKGFDREASQQAIALIEHMQGWSKEAGARYDIDANGKPVRREINKNKALEISSRAKVMELHTGEKSLERIAQEEAAPIIKDATSWKDLHDKLAEKGIRFEREGSGAKVYIGDAPVGIKASDVDRKASFGNLQKRFGAYQPAKEIKSNDYHHHTKEQDAPASRTPTTDRVRKLSECNLAELNAKGKTVRQGVLHIDARASGRRSDGLRREAGRSHGHFLDTPQPLAPGQAGWNEYRKIRDEQKAAKEADKLAVTNKQAAERKALAAALKAEREKTLQGDWKGKGQLRNALQSVLATQQAAKKIELAERHREEKKELRERYKPLPMYRQWQEQPQIVGAEIKPKHEQEAERDRQSPKLSDTLKELQHDIDKRGHITYTSNGKELFRDEGRSIAVLDSKSDKAIAAALATAQQKFGNELTITGSDEFKKNAVAVAVENNLTCRFADPQLQALRDKMVVEKMKVEQLQEQVAAANKKAELEKKQKQEIERPAPTQSKGRGYEPGR